MDYDGMTINERLHSAGLIEDFDQSIVTKNYKKAVKILLKIKLTPEQADVTINSIFENPKKYGY